MFTGLVQALGIVARVADTEAGKRLVVSLSELAHAQIALGDSVAVNGVCLTVTNIANSTAAFDVVSETLRRTTLGTKRPGDRVNLELSLRPDSFVGGHFVQGHVDTLGKVAAVQSQAEDWRITIEVPAEFMPTLVPKGSVTVDGVSMTIAAVAGNTFTIAVIPTTLQATTLSALKVGDPVNIETDILARTVVHWLQLQAGGGAAGTPAADSEGLITKLREQGFA